MKILTVINEKIEEWMLTILLSFIVILVLAQVISRNLFSFPMGWSVELSRYIFVWIAWISASYAVKKKTHIRVELFKNKLNNTSRKVLELIVLLLWLAFSLFLAIAGTQFVISIGSTSQSSPSLEVPMWIVYLAVPIAGLLMSYRVVQQGILIFKEKES
jgi:C4-dicarboxylate transporter DctQ subunit